MRDTPVEHFQTGDFFKDLPRILNLCAKSADPRIPCRPEPLVHPRESDFTLFCTKKLYSPLKYLHHNMQERKFLRTTSY